MKAPQAGDLKWRCDIWEVTAPYSTPDGLGTYVSTFASGLPCKLEWLAGSDMEVLQTAQMSRQPFNLWIRYRPGVTAFQQIKLYDGDVVRMLKISGPPEEIVRRQWLLLHCEETIVRILP